LLFSGSTGDNHVQEIRETWFGLTEAVLPTGYTVGSFAFLLRRAVDRVPFTARALSLYTLAKRAYLPARFFAAIG